MRQRCVVLMVFALACFPAAAAQNSVVPRLVKFSGIVKDSSGAPQTGIVGITFALYAAENGGVPLWSETQNAELDLTGRYTAFIGAASADGIPFDLFASGQAQWLGVRPEGGPEGRRAMLVSVPYALKAGDAETLGGKPASAFLPAPQVEPPSAKPDTTTGNGAPAILKSGKAQPNVSGTGTAGYIPLWIDNAGTLGNSVITQSGGKVGIGVTSPLEELDVSGGIRMNGCFFRPDNAGCTANFTNGTNYYYGVHLFNNTYGNATNMVITNAGSVGIGTTAPAYGLDVAATARVGRLIVNGGVTPTGSGLKHARTTASCKTGGNPGDQCYITINWPGTPFADTNYTTTCSIGQGLANNSGAIYAIITDPSNGLKTTSSLAVTVENLGSVAVTINGVDCIAIHD